MSTLLAGIILMVLTGICWTGLGVIVSKNAKTGVSTPLVLGASTLMVAIICAVCLFFKGSFPLNLSGKYGLTHLLYLTCGFFNFLAFVLMSKAMRIGNNGIVWSIVQSALICPFMMGIIAFGVEPRITRLAGVSLVLFAIIMMGLSKSENQKHEKGGSKLWLWITLLGFLDAGLTQCLANVPSYWPEAQSMSPIEKTMSSQMGNVLGCLVFEWKHIFTKESWRGITRPLISYLALNLLNQFAFFFNGLEKLAQAGAGSIGYPIGLGLCISAFFTYSLFIIHEKTTKLGLCGFFACLAGIIVISC